MTIYLVRRHDGTYLQYGFNWTTDMDEAQIYTKTGPAKTRCTRWARMHPGEPVLQLLSLTFTAANMQVVDMTERTTKRVASLRAREAKRADAHAKWEIEQLTRKHVEIKQRLAALQG